MVVFIEMKPINYLCSVDAWCDRCLPHPQRASLSLCCPIAVDRNLLPVLITYQYLILRHAFSKKREYDTSEARLGDAHHRLGVAEKILLFLRSLYEFL